MTFYFSPTQIPFKFDNCHKNVLEKVPSPGSFIAFGFHPSLVFFSLEHFLTLFLTFMTTFEDSRPVISYIVPWSAFVWCSVLSCQVMYLWQKYHRNSSLRLTAPFLMVHSVSVCMTGGAAFGYLAHWRWCHPGFLEVGLICGCWVGSMLEDITVPGLFTT